MKLEVSSTRTMFDDQSFTVDRPRVWNSLPASTATQHYQLLSFLIDLRLIASFTSCGFCNSEQSSIYMF